MKHRATPEFWNRYRELPAATRDMADRSFQLLKTTSDHPSLHFRNVGRYASVSVGKGYRALSVGSSEELIWFWIGVHTEYDRLLRS